MNVSTKIETLIPFDVIKMLAKHDFTADNAQSAISNVSVSLSDDGQNIIILSTDGHRAQELVIRNPGVSVSFPNVAAVMPKSSEETGSVVFDIKEASAIVEFLKMDKVKNKLPEVIVSFDASQGVVRFSLCHISATNNAVVQSGNLFDLEGAEISFNSKWLSECLQSAITTARKGDITLRFYNISKGGANMSPVKIEGSIGYGVKNTIVLMPMRRK